MATDGPETHDEQPGGWAPLILITWSVTELFVVLLLVHGNLGEGPVLLLACLLVACAAGLAFGVAMAKERCTVWLLPAVPMVALLMMLAVAAGASEQGDGFDPGPTFLLLLIFLGVPAAVGPLLEALWRLGLRLLHRRATDR